MKNGTEYARRVKRVYKKLLEESTRPVPEEATSPTEQLVRALLAWEGTPTQGERAYRAVFEHMVDLNEVRVATVAELSAILGAHLPNSVPVARNVCRALNSIYRREHRVSLDPLRDKGRREARQYLESLPGVNPYASASVLLWSLGAHAIPVSQRLLEALRSADLVDPGAQPEDVQGFLERNIAADEARRFCVTMERFADEHTGRPASRTDARKKAATATAPSGGTGQPDTKAPRRKGTKAAETTGRSSTAAAAGGDAPRPHGNGEAPRRSSKRSGPTSTKHKKP